MAPSQKQVCLIMVQSIQAQLVGLMNVIGVNAAPHAPAPNAFPSQPQAPEHLTDEEEETVERELEQVRIEASRESDSIQARWKAQREAMEEAGTFA